MRNIIFIAILMLVNACSETPETSPQSPQKDVLEQVRLTTKSVSHTHNLTLNLMDSIFGSSSRFKVFKPTSLTSSLRYIQTQGLDSIIGYYKENKQMFASPTHHHHFRLFTIYYQTSLDAVHAFNELQMLCKFVEMQYYSTYPRQKEIKLSVAQVSQAEVLDNIMKMGIMFVLNKDNIQVVVKHCTPSSEIGFESWESYDKFVLKQYNNQKLLPHITADCGLMRLIQYK